MNKIKDIIYDKSDILIAILILALAAIIIAWRLGIILEYPKEIIGTDDPSNVLVEPTGDEEGSQTEGGEAGTEAQKGEDGSKAGENESGKNESGENQSGENKEGEATGSEGEKESGESTQEGEKTESEGSKAESETDEPEEDAEAVSTTANWDGKKLAEDLEVTITGTTASAAVQCLVDAGVFESYAEYKDICTKNGFNDEKMRAGVFTFKKGSTKLDIIKTVNWSFM